MSATYSSANLPYEPGSAVNALCLSLSSARKRCSFEEREPIKKRRKQLNPVRLSLEPLEDPSSSSHGDLSEATPDEPNTTYPRYAFSSTDITTSEPSVTSKAIPKQTFKAPPHESPSPLVDLNCTDSVPLNLTKSNARTSPKLEEIKIESKVLSPQSEDSKSESPPFSPRAPQPATVMRNLYTSAVSRATSCRIFNPEAFCNICNKEFCNKYFLKTHKANKHGVYCESKESNSNDTELPAVPLMFSWNVKNNTVKIPAAAAAAAAAVSNAYVFHASNTIKDSSAFCSICEKEFCNKYFLRRHKEKMHGIVPLNGSRKAADQGSEKSEEDEKSQPDQEVKSNSSTDRINELHYFNSKFDKNKFSKLAASSADAVSDFIRLCLGGGGAKFLRDHDKLANGEALADQYQLAKRDESLDLNKHISKFAAEHEQRLRLEAAKAARTCGGESAMQANDDDLASCESSFKASNTSFEEHLCEFCKKSLSTRAVRKLHQKYVHAVSSEDDKEDSDFRQMENVYFMIVKFSWLNTAVTYCEICHTDFEKNDALEMHLMNKHSLLVDELSRIIEDAGVNGLFAPSLSIGDGNILCQICNKTFPTNVAFQQHVYEKCSYSDVCSEFYSNAEDADSSKSTRNFCEICKKELCNKYFMKTHMRRMHGIAIQNGVRIGGVTCEICNKELCSKYFLRVHKKNCHGVMEKANISRFLVGENERSDLSQSCVICGRLFKSIKWLKTHLFNDHGNLGAGIWQDVSLSTGDVASDLHNSELPETSSYSDEGEEKATLPQLYDCSTCHFQLASVDALLAHQRLHAKSSEDRLQYQCMYCFVVTKDKLSLEEHIAYHHHSTAEFHENIELGKDAKIETKNSVYRVPNTT